jgi:hypothetical protein
MTITISSDEKNDIYIGANGNLSISSGLNAVMQAAQQAVQTQLGEMIYATDKGIPNFSAVWNGAANIAQFDAALRRTLLAVEHVIGIDDLTISVQGNKLSYTVIIQTDFGSGALNG